MDVERLIERLAVIADTSFLDHAAADDLREAAAVLAKLQAERDEAREVLRPFKAAFEYGVTELPDDIQAIQLMRSRVGFKHFRAASRALGGGE